MTLPAISRKQRTINRAKAFGQLSWPLLVIAVIAFLSSALMRPYSAPAVNNTRIQAQAGHEGWLSADTASSLGASVEVTTSPQLLRSGKNGNATTVMVTTYTVYPTF